MAAALHAQIGFRRSDQSQSSTPGQTINGGPVLRYFLSETIQAQENGSRGTHFAKFLISNFPKGLTYSAMFIPSHAKYENANTHSGGLFYSSSETIFVTAKLLQKLGLFSSDEINSNFKRKCCHQIETCWRDHGTFHILLIS